MKRPTFMQRVFAWRWPAPIFLLAVALAVGVGLVHDTGYHFELVTDWRATLWVVGVFILGSLSGFIMGVFLMWLLLSGLQERQARRNGAPFAVGDRVQILAGPHRGKVARVYSPWQGNAVRVRLGEGEEEHFKDIFSPHELLRQDEED